MMEPEYETDILEEHATFTGTVNKLDEYLKSVLGVRQGRKNGQAIPDPSVPKEAFDAATIKGFLEAMANPLFTHVSYPMCVCRAKTCSNDVSYHSSSMRSNGWIPRNSAPVASPRKGSQRSMPGWGNTSKTKWYTPSTVFSSIIRSLHPSLIPRFSFPLCFFLKDTSVLVFVFGHVPPYSPFPGLPWVVRKILVPWVFWWKHRTVSHTRPCCPIHLLMQATCSCGGNTSPNRLYSLES